MAVSRWMFTKEQILNTPSRKHGIDSDKELSYRQQAANLIQDMGQRLSVTQLCINTAIVYMHRFYMFQSFGRFPRNDLAPACLFLAAKVEEQPRKLEHVIRVAHACLHRDNTQAPDPQTEAYLEQAQTIVVNENILLQTLGFETSVDHPHTHVVKTTSLVKASKDLAQTSYFLATNSLHLTTFCLQYRPSIVACVCIYLASKWSNWKIARSNEGKEWYHYVDRTATQELLEELCTEFLNILDKGPNKLKKKIMGWKAGHREQLYQGEEEKQSALEMRKMKTELPSTSHDPSRSSASSSQHRHTNHDRKHGQEKREHNERKEETDRREHADRREMHTHSERKEIGPTGDGHPVVPPKREPHLERRDIPERREERKDINDRRNAEIRGANERRDHIEKKDQSDRKAAEIKKEVLERKDHEAKMNVHRREGERRETVSGKEPQKHKPHVQERNFLDVVSRKDLIDGKISVSEKQEKKTVDDRTDSGVHNFDHMSRTSHLQQNVKIEGLKPETNPIRTESHASDQTSAKAEFVVPNLEKFETHQHSKEHTNSSMSASNASANVVPVSLKLPPAADSVKSGLHKSKSEMTLNYKDYLQRKERERQQLLERQGKLNLNKTFTEGSQGSSKVHKQDSLDISLPLIFEDKTGLEKIKEEKDTKIAHDISVRNGQESEARKRTDHETKVTHGNAVKPRKRSNSKSPGASKRSPRVHNSNSVKVSPGKTPIDPSAESRIKTIKAENPHLKLQISDHSESSLTAPTSPLKSPVKNLKEIPKSEPFVNLGEPLKTDGKQRRFSGHELEKLTGFDIEQSKTKPEPESVNVSIPKVTLKQSPRAQAILKSETKDISKLSPKVSVKQESIEFSDLKHSPNVVVRHELDETAKKSPVLHNRHPLKEPNAAKQSPLVHDKHPTKDINAEKQIITVKQEARESKQSPLNAAKHDQNDVKASKQSPRMVLKQEAREKKSSTQSPKLYIKHEPTENNTEDIDIRLKPEHTGHHPLKLHIKELPDASLDIAESKSVMHDAFPAKSESPIPSLKISIKKEPGSGGNTPVKYKSEHSDGSTPLKLTIKQEASSSGSPYEPLKMKLKTSHSGEHHGEKHHRHREGHKHKHKHKSHKHKDKDRDRERKHSRHSVEVPGNDGKQELKIRVKLGQPPSTDVAGSSNSQSGTYQISKHDKHKNRDGANVVPDKNSHSEQSERHQPWSASELVPKSDKKAASSPSRKRRRPPAVDDGTDISLSQPQQKAAKTDSRRLRRSSSSHSVVSMEMSDNECGEDVGQIKTDEDKLKALKIKLEQHIQLQQKRIDDTMKQQKSIGYSGLKAHQPAYERQKSGFDLDLYCGNSTGTPPLPQGQPPLPPTPPLSQVIGTPPPPPPPPPPTS